MYDILTIRKCFRDRDFIYSAPAVIKWQTTIINYTNLIRLIINTLNIT